MNEASNFCGGCVCRLRDGGHPPTNFNSSDRRAVGALLAGSLTECALDCEQPAANDLLCHPPYAINSLNRHAPLCKRDIPTNARHYDGSRECVGVARGVGWLGA